MSWRAEVDHSTIWLYPDNSDEPYRLSPDEAWDLGDSLIISAGQVWQQDTGQPWNPDWPAAVTAPSDQEWLDERATGVLFTDDQLSDLRTLAQQRGMTVARMVREELLASLASSTWGDHDVTSRDPDVARSADVDVAQDAEGEDRNADTDPAVPEPEPDTEPVHDTHGGGDQIKDDSQHRRWVLPGDVQ